VKEKIKLQFILALVLPIRVVFFSKTNILNNTSKMNDENIETSKKLDIEKNSSLENKNEKLEVYRKSDSEEIPLAETGNLIKFSFLVIDLD
jgi:hypothetical protein